MTNSRSRTRVAVVGLGMAVRPHAQSLVDLSERIEVAAAFSPSAARREAFGGQYAFPLVDHLETIVRDRSITAVLVLTPPNTHLDLVRVLAPAGKHILLEKPVELDLPRARAVVECCRQHGVTLGVVFQHRFRPASMRLATLIASGRLGQVAAASVSIRWWRPQSYYDQPGRGTYSRDGGGVLITQAIHTLDLFGSLVGPVAEVAAFSGTTAVHRMESEDVVGAAIRLAGGAIGGLDATTAAYPGFPERIEIVGTLGTAVLSGDALEVHFHDSSNERVAGSGSTGGGADPMAFANDAHRGVLVDFLDAIDTFRPPRASGEAALAVHALIAALERSAAERRVVRLNEL